MEIQYQVISEKKLLIQRYIGVYSLEHYCTYMNDLIKKDEWKCVQKVLTDLREVNLEHAFENLTKLIDFRDKVVIKKYRNVFLVDNPFSTATVHLYQNELNNKEYDYKYCSTIEKAIQLLKLNESEKEFEFKLRNLENQF
ncbi:MAG: hypothetical protein DRJ05_11965 [Bacteroidetes bacterium]|nr:MAG: hypothetical protein DRJ05_11965 [Bacteroidota bacterium]